MKKLLIALFIVFASCAPEKETISALNGTKWEYKDAEKSYFIAFDDSSKIHTTNNTDWTLSNDFWYQLDDTLTMRFNNYSIYKGLIRDSLIIGYGSNPDSTWVFEMKRVDYKLDSIVVTIE